ncbi:MAG: hypothetical protein WD382_10995 [Halofilum sp. (in: g-proteobacteria)]
MPGSASVALEDDPRPALCDLARGLFRGERDSEPDLLANEPPNPWRGLGDFGQGGQGMMGGTPYGRMMPMPPQADLRDGLMLDAYTATVGPFLPTLPPGLVLEVTWQGDIIQSARLVRVPFEPPRDAAAPFHRALSEPGSISVLERIRAANHLRCLAHVLELLELHRLARRCRRTAVQAITGETIDVARLMRAVRRSGALAAAPPGLGRLPEEVAAEIGGVARRAGGKPVDVRARQREYADLGFEPITHAGGDVRARLLQWMEEAEQAVKLAEHARLRERVRFAHAVESPWGPLPATGHYEPSETGFDFTDLLVGCEWLEAMLVVASFDVAALARMTPRSPDPGLGEP